MDWENKVKVKEMRHEIRLQEHVGSIYKKKLLNKDPRQYRENKGAKRK